MNIRNDNQRLRTTTDDKQTSASTHIRPCYNVSLCQNIGYHALTNVNIDNLDI